MLRFCYLSYLVFSELQGFFIWCLSLILESPLPLLFPLVCFFFLLAILLPSPAFWNYPTVLICSVSFFSFFVLFAFWFMKFLSFCLQDNSVFLWLCPVYSWAHQRQPSFLLWCFWSLVFIFGSSSGFSSLCLHISFWF